MATPVHDVPPALGTVVDEGRGRLPFALIHGEALVATAVWALGEAGVTPVDATVAWERVRAAGEPFVLHDPLCPMTPPAFIAECLARAVETDAVVVGVREVTDTVKALEGDRVGATLDRSGLAVVCSPIVLPPTVVAAVESLPGPRFAPIVAALEQRFPVERLPAPPEARRVSSEDELVLLAALTEPVR